VYDVIMKDKNKIIKERIVPLNKSMLHIQRWHLCQRIGKIYYDSNLGDVELAEIKQTIFNNLNQY